MTKALRLTVAFLSVLSLGLIVALIVVATRSKSTVLDPSSSEDEDRAQTGTKNSRDVDHGDQPPDLDLDPKPAQPWERDLRLPRSVLPIHYDLYLFPDLKLDIFTGTVSIRVLSLEAREYFLLHSKNLEVRKVTMVDLDGQNEVKLKELVQFEPHEFLVLKPKKGPARPGNYTIVIEFKGELKKSLSGLYQSEYTNAKGQKVKIATSKFQPTYARRAFPCFDEPSFKSTFSVTLVRPSHGYIGLSNMPVASEVANSPRPGLTEVKFEKSVPMVTYLVCFIVCDFEYEEKFTDVHRTRFRVYASPVQKASLEYALRIGTNITDFFEDYFETEYPLPKQDMVAIPDFPSGAMEHWGVITYRETNLLFDDSQSSSANQERVATVISHELAHQWFGNLVTLSWWDDLWLNEGFASFLEYKGVANYHPDWEMEDQFLVDDLHPVLRLDSTSNSHPIIQEVKDPDQISEIFDSIAYSKGASVIRMLESFLGGEVFRTGIKNFLDRYKYSNAVTGDLWHQLEEVSSDGQNVSRIMDTWTRQMGYPLIQVSKVGNQQVYRLAQTRFSVDQSKASEGPESPFDYKWDVPITYCTKLEKVPSKVTWLRMEDPSVDIPTPAGSGWVKFNVGQMGYYRVNYPREMWDQFVHLLVKGDHLQLAPTDRAHLLDDAFALAEAGMLDYSVPLSMVEYLRRETSPLVWATAYSRLLTLQGLLRDTSTYPMLRKFYLNLVENHFESLKWTDVGSHRQRLHRVNILNLACLVGHSKCLQEAKEAFSAWIMDSSTEVPPNLRTLAYRYGMAEIGNEELWNTMLERYIAEGNAQERGKILYGLASIREPWILNNFISLASNETIVRKQDYFTALSRISMNPIGCPVVWKFLRNKWPELVQRFTLNDRYLGRLPKTVTYRFSSRLELQEMKQFFAQYPEAGAGERSRKQALEQVENNIRWLERNEDAVSKWLFDSVSTPSLDVVAS